MAPVCIMFYVDTTQISHINKGHDLALQHCTYVHILHNLAKYKNCPEAQLGFGDTSGSGISLMLMGACFYFSKACMFT